MKNQWHLVLRSDDVDAKKPRGIQVNGVPLVLFRDERGTPRALLDACPHRQAKLSQGSCRDGHLVCPYHGWSFDGEGKVQSIPSMTSKGRKPDVGAPSFPCFESEGSIWVIPTANLPPEQWPPFPSWPGDPSEGFQWFELVNVFDSEFEDLIENFVDVCHTPFVHAGIFRSNPQKGNRGRKGEAKGSQTSVGTLTAHIRETPTGVVIASVESKSQASVLGRLFRQKTGETTHTDEFIFPFAVKVDYAGESWAVRSVSICTPLGPSLTRVTTRVYIRAGIMTAPLKAILKIMTTRILEQDRSILAGQSENIRWLGARRRVLAVQGDEPLMWISRRMRDLRDAKPERELREMTATYEV